MKEVLNPFGTSSKVWKHIDEAIRSFPATHRVRKIVTARGSVEITLNELKLLHDGGWLNDRIIDGFLGLLEERSKLSTFPTVCALTSFFYTTFVSQGYHKVQRWTKKVDIFSVNMILVPINQNGNHWVLACVHNVNKTISYYDSFGVREELNPQILATYLALEYRDKKHEDLDLGQWTVEYMNDIPTQRNTYDCGVFLCKFAEFLSRNATISFTHLDIPFYRKRLKYELITANIICP